MKLIDSQNSSKQYLGQLPMHLCFIPIPIVCHRSIHTVAILVEAWSQFSKLRIDGLASVTQRDSVWHSSAMDSEIEALPQLRFPLREALLSLHDSVNEPPSVRTALAGSASLATLGPYKVSSTEKSRALKKIGRLKRRGEHIGRGYAEERPLHTPRPPPESERPKTVPKSVPSAVSRKKVAFVRSAQDAAEMECWPSLQKSQSAPEVSSMSCFSATPMICRQTFGQPGLLRHERFWGTGGGRQHDNTPHLKDPKDPKEKQNKWMLRRQACCKTLHGAVHLCRVFQGFQNLWRIGRLWPALAWSSRMLALALEIERTQRWRTSSNDHQALTTRWSVGTWAFGTRMPPYRPSSRYHSTSLLHQLHLGHGVTHRRNMNDSLVLATTMCLDLRMSFCERSLSDQPWSPHDGAGPCQNLLLVITGILRLHQFHAKRSFLETQVSYLKKHISAVCLLSIANRILQIWSMSYFLKKWFRKKYSVYLITSIYHNNLSIYSSTEKTWQVFHRHIDPSTV